MRARPASALGPGVPAWAWVPRVTDLRKWPRTVPDGSTRRKKGACPLRCSLALCSPALHAGLGTPRLLHGSRGCPGRPALAALPPPPRACGTPRPVAPPPPRRPGGCPALAARLLRRAGDAALAAPPWPACVRRGCRSHCTGSSRPPAWCTSRLLSASGTCFSHEGLPGLFQATLGMLRLKVTAQPRASGGSLAASPRGWPPPVRSHRLLRPELQPIGAGCLRARASLCSA